MTESEERLKSLLIKVNEESEKAGLKLSIQKTKIMASGAITSWQINGETIETVTDFIFLGSKITGDGDYSHEIKRHLLLGPKATTNLDSILKSSDITLLTKVCHSFSSKEQISFNFMAVVAICSDFGAQGNKVCHCFYCFPIYLL